MSQLVDISAAGWKSWKGQNETLVVFAFQDELPILLALGKEAKAIAELAKTDGFKGKERETLLCRPAAGMPAQRLLLIGLGKKSEFNPETLRRAASSVVTAGESLGWKELPVRLPEIARSPRALQEEMQALAEGLYLASYRFDRHQTPAPDAPKPLGQVTLLSDKGTAAVGKAIASAQFFSRATTLARDLINEPPSRMNPERLAEEAKKIHTGAVAVKVYETKDLEKMGMGGLLGVGAGGAVPPRLVELIYKRSGKTKKVRAVVGKGITCDSGGLSLKPAQSMETMKDDMSGPAAVRGGIKVLSE